MKFTKMQGCGNNYIYVNLFEEKIDNPNLMAEKVADKNFGIGSDGLITIGPSDKADFFMDIYNADGSQAMMCGNGIRCVAKYVYDHKMTDKTTIAIDTMSGVKTVDVIVGEDGLVNKVSVDMGAPILEPSQIPVKYEGETMINVPVTVGSSKYHLTSVSMGNPHTICFVDDVYGLNLEEIGPFFERHEIFPERVNTEFIHVIDRNTIDMRVYERGSGETLACGTGACASVVACVLNGFTDNHVLVHLLGGDLEIEYDTTHNTVIMTGPAAYICTGELL